MTHTIPDAFGHFFLAFKVYECVGRKIVHQVKLLSDVCQKKFLCFKLQKPTSADYSLIFITLGAMLTKDPLQILLQNPAP
jgi:hypothetical protein